MLLVRAIFAARRMQRSISVGGSNRCAVRQSLTFWQPLGHEPLQVHESNAHGPLARIVQPTRQVSDPFSRGATSRG